MKRVAILGANGFIGSRLCEVLHLQGLAEVRPVVRKASRIAGLSKFRLDQRVADACDAQVLREAFEGCHYVVHAVAGPPEVITGSVKPVYEAAQQAGVRRLVYLSTASVHGQSPEVGTTEESPLSETQPLPYNNAKVRAEHILRSLRKSGHVELVMLRPGIVLGPRSYWVASFAEALLCGRAYLVEEGRGICNSVYVDNLVHAIDLAMTAPGVDGEAMFVGDNELVTWADVYRGIAIFLGYDLEQVARREPVVLAEPVGKAKQLSTLIRSLWSRMPVNLRKALWVARAPLKKSRPRSPWEARPAPEVEVTLEMSLLYTCRFKLPNSKAERLMGYRPVVSFDDACRRTIGWLGFAGYPGKSLQSE